MPIRNLMAMRSCGARTIAELVRLIGRAPAGEFFTPPTGAEWNPAEMVRMLDALAAGLPERNRKILKLRLGGEQRKRPTLETIATQFGLTRERVRQVVVCSLERIRKGGSLRLKWHLEQLDRRCRRTGSGFSSVLFGQWLDSSSASHRFPLAFYVHLIVNLNPGIKMSGVDA